MSDIMGQLTRFILETKYEDLPEPIIHTTKNLLLDTLGCGLGWYYHRSGENSHRHR